MLVMETRRKSGVMLVKHRSLNRNYEENTQEKNKKQSVVTVHLV